MNDPTQLTPRERNEQVWRKEARRGYYPLIVGFVVAVIVATAALVVLR